MAVRSLQLTAATLADSDGTFCDITASCDVRVPANSGLITQGNAIVTVPVRQQLAMVHSDGSDVPVLAVAVSIDAGSNSIPLEIVNNSEFPLLVSKGDRVAILCQVDVHIPEVADEYVNDTEFLKAFDVSHLSETETLEMQDFLLRNKDVFALSTAALGGTDVVTHRIELDDPIPFKQKTRPIPPGAYTELKEHIADLLNSGVIRESKSPFSSNMVLVRKRDGSL